VFHYPKMISESAASIMSLWWY